MKLDDYQDATAQTAIYPGSGSEEGLTYVTLGLTGEAGEVAEKLKKFKREGDTSYVDDMEDELGDVLWYLARVADELDMDLSEVADRNLDKLLDREERNVLEGEGDDR